MTKKHFIALADILRKHHTWACCKRSDLTFKMLTEDIADLCAEQNPRFNREKWLEYLNQS
jgi:hypothetical protein